MWYIVSRAIYVVWIGMLGCEPKREDECSGYENAKMDV